MTPYRTFLDELNSYADENYKNFHKKLLKNDNIAVLGVKIPILRKLAKKYFCEVDNLLTYPDEYYEVTFVKLSAVSLLSYPEFIKRVDGCVALINNWAACDGFAPGCIKTHKAEFLPYIRKYAQCGGEFYRRFALTTLLHFYVEDYYIEVIFSVLDGVDTSDYYVSMAAAWLVAETLTKFYMKARGYLAENSLDKKTHNRAIQKAVESLRLSGDEKNYLKGMKR